MNSFSSCASIVYLIGDGIVGGELRCQLFIIKYRHAKGFARYILAEWHLSLRMKFLICSLYEANAMKFQWEHGPA